MDDRKPEDTNPDSGSVDPKIPPPPPFDPDPRLIGDMERSEKPATSSADQPTVGRTAG